MKRVIGSALLLCATLSVACDTDPSADGEGGEGGDLQSACPAPTAGPTIHDGVIEADEVWRAEDGPHIVSQWVTVRNGATLTIDPCATVEVEAGKGISVAYPTSPNTGSLVARGEEDRPITFKGKDGARWGHLFFAPGAKGDLAHVAFEGGGGDDLLGATLAIEGDGTFPMKRDVRVEHVTISGSRGVGARLDRLGGFADGSTDLVVTGSGDEEMPYALYIDEHAIDTLPRGSYTGNARDAIFVDPDFHLEEDVTMKSLGVPYVIGTFPGDSLVVGSGLGDTIVTLTVEPGVVAQFHPGTALEIEHYTGDEAASGVLVAEGTAAAPIVFTSAAESPQPGDWQGLAFGGIPSADNSIKHARIEYTGADCGCIFLTCSAIDGFEGAVIFSQQPPRAFIEDTVIAHGSSHGVVLGYAGSRVDFKEGITFEGMEGCEQTLPVEDGTCPSPKPACE